VVVNLDVRHFWVVVVLRVVMVVLGGRKRQRLLDGGERMKGTEGGGCRERKATSVMKEEPPGRADPICTPVSTPRLLHSQGNQH
jgi:hypothetical protein